MKKVMNAHYHYDHPYVDNDTFYHMPASFGSIEEAFERIRENDIIPKHCGGPEGGVKTTALIRKIRQETLKIYTQEMFSVFHTDNEDRQHELTEQLKRFLVLIGYCNIQEYLKGLGNSASFMDWWFVYKHNVFINTNLFIAMLLAYESRHMSEENRERALYTAKSAVENYASCRCISKKVVLDNIKKLISLWRDAEVKPEKKRTDPN